MGAVVKECEVLSYESAGRPKGSRFARVMLALAWVYPLLPLIALYTTWLIAWWVLGHRPRSSIDDPKFIGGPVDAAYVATALLLMSFPVGSLVEIGVGLATTARYVHSRGWSLKRAGLLALALVIFYAGCWTVLRWDPLKVLYWYMD